MKLKLKYGISAKDEDIVVFSYQDKINNLKPVLQKYIIASNILTRLGFTGKRDDVLELHPTDSHGSIIFLGLGEKGKSNSENARRAGGLLAGITVARSLKSVALVELPDQQDNLAAFVEGLILGGYDFNTFKSDKKPEPSLTLALNGEYKKLISEIEKAMTVAEAACYARDLINTPANFLTPTSYAAKVRALGKKYKISTRVYGKNEIQKLKMGAMLAVAEGSDQQPKLITFTYNGGKKGEAPIVLVGKGVTFDTGGISLKPNSGMQDMKNDMAGSATVIAQMIVLGTLKPKINVVGIVPAVENMPSGRALKPTDIITASDGQTIEVLNTDAEGRLILADGLCYAHKFKPKAILDIATLTGAVRYALGHNAAGILGKDDNLIEKLYYIGQKTGERVWQLPLWDEYYEQIKSNVADMKNVGGPAAGTITAAAFLSKFVKDIPWAHIDIAAMDNQEGSHPYQPKGATGYGVRLLAEFLMAD